MSRSRLRPATGRWAILLASLLALGRASAASAPGYPPETVLLVVAAWCAPCHGEVARLAEIGRGARPYRVLVAAFDDSRATRAMLEAVPPAQRWQPDRAALRQLVAEVERRSPGLPFSLAIDRDGHVCGGQGEALDAASAAKLVAACRR
jgi:hypothetical protein